MDPDTRPTRHFPLPDDFPATRIPNAVLGTLLALKPDPSVVTLVLRAIWLLERQRTFPRNITIDELRHDRVLSVTLETPDQFDNALEEALTIGVLINADGGLLMLNTESAVRQAASIGKSSSADRTSEAEAGGWEASASSALPVDAFRAYEENIGALSPIIRENITNALQDFTDEHIAEAIKIAVENESRTWAFVAGVLRRWARDGVPNDPRSGSTRQSDEQRGISDAELRRYLDRQRESG